MSVYKIENKKLSIDINGQIYAVKKPKYKDLVDIEEKMASMSPKEKVLFVHSRLIEYGIPEEVLNDLDSDAYVELIEVINGTKKN